jgi:hypothetical protein
MLTLIKFNIKKRTPRETKIAQILEPNMIEKMGCF